MHWIYDTERYRYATIDDIAAIADMLSDPEVGRWLWFTPAPRETFEAFFEPFVEQQAQEVAKSTVPQSPVFVVEDLSGRFLGQGAVVEVEGSPGGFEVGFQLHKHAWGRGVGTRLSQFLAAYAVHCCNAYRIEGGCLEGNVGSRRLLTKLGLQLEATRPGYRLKEQTRHTELQFGALVSDLDTAELEHVAHETGLIDGHDD